MYIVLTKPKTFFVNKTQSIDFTCIHTNADQFLNKRAEFKRLVEIHNPSIIGITEVKPKNYRYEIQDCELSLEGYEVFHNMRKEGRGLVLYVKEELKASMVEELASDAMESIFVDCHLQDNKTLRVGLMYRSPNSSTENNKAFNDLLSKASDQKNFHLLVMGDFNYKEID